MSIVDSARNVLATLAEIAQTRLELLSNEVQAEVNHLARRLYLGALLVALVTLAVAFVGVAVIVIFWDDHRILSASLVAAVFVLAAAVVAYRLQQAVNGQPRLFSASLNELAKDRERLRPVRSTSETSGPSTPSDTER